MVPYVTPCHSNFQVHGCWPFSPRVGSFGGYDIPLPLHLCIQYAMKDVNEKIYLLPIYMTDKAGHR